MTKPKNDKKMIKKLYTISQEYVDKIVAIADEYDEDRGEIVKMTIGGLVAGLRASNRATEEGDEE